MVRIFLLLDHREHDTDWINKIIPHISGILIQHTNTQLYNIESDDYICEVPAGSHLEIDHKTFQRDALIEDCYNIPIHYKNGFYDYVPLLYKKEGDACGNFDCFKLVSEIKLKIDDIPLVYDDKPLTHFGFNDSHHWYGSYQMGHRCFKHGYKERALIHFRCSHEYNPKRLEPYLELHKLDNDTYPIQTLRQLTKNVCYPVLIDKYKEARLLL